jgi:hypothetical protein
MKQVNYPNNQNDKENALNLLQAIGDNKLEEAKQLISRRTGSMNQSYTQDSQTYYTFLTLAIACNNVAMVELLNKYGADVNIRTNQGSPLEILTREKGYMWIEKLLLAHGALITEDSLSSNNELVNDPQYEEYQYIDLQKIRTLQDRLIIFCKENQLDIKLLDKIANGLEREIDFSISRSPVDSEKQMAIKLAHKAYKEYITPLDMILNSQFINKEGREASCLSQILMAAECPEEVFKTLNPNDKTRNVEGYAEFLKEFNQQIELFCTVLPRVLNKIVAEYCVGDKKWQKKILAEKKVPDLSTAKDFSNKVSGFGELW